MPKLLHNTEEVLRLCQENHITSSIVVVKVLAGYLPVVKKIANYDFAYLGDSRLDNLIRFKNIAKKKALLRLPSLDEVDKVVEYADLSLNSEIETIIALDKAAKKKHKFHEILLMFDLGDLREGIFYQDDYLSIVEKIITLKSIKLIGIGTNLTCYGGIVPTNENLNILVEIKKKIESHFNIKLAIVSGGNSSSFHLLTTHTMPKAINNLRYGEVLFMGRETSFGKTLPNLYSDVFMLQAEIIEVKTKPSYPIGKIGFNSFGEEPVIVDKGIMRRGILAIGKQDVILENLTSRNKNITIIGGSSDHLLVDLTKSEYVLGDVMDFNLNYPALLHLMNSKYVDKLLINK